MNTSSATDVLVLIHPGSACGSADFNIGYAEGREARKQLIAELASWQGGIIVIDDGLSDELPDFPAYAQAIHEAVDRAKNAGHIARRLFGEEPAQVRLVAELIKAMPEQGHKQRYTVTGAWYHPDDGGGCVGEVVKELRRLGCQAELGASAVHMCFDDDDAEFELTDEELEEIRMRTTPRRRP